MDVEPLEAAVSNLSLTSNYSSDEDDDSCCDEPVLLGFLKKPEHKWSLARHQFPSKVGGPPAWLDPLNIPEDGSCDFCKEPMEFLLQVYAPIGERDDTFHRTLFIFMCSNLTCLQRHQVEQKTNFVNSKRSTKIYRCQLPRKNEFYAAEPPRSNGLDLPLTKGVPLCSWCGAWRGGKCCGSCKMTRYCCRAHQTSHWRAGHSTVCKQIQMQSVSTAQLDLCNEGSTCALPAKAGLTTASNKKLWPEFELFVEEEEDEEQALQYNASKEEEEEEDKEMDVIKDLKYFEEAPKECHIWASFQARIAKSPNQVLRYCRSRVAKPVWLNSNGQLEASNAPLCSLCGGPCIFECQVLPQLLYYLQVQNEPGSLDWGTIVVYSCAASCTTKGYVEEYAWVQMAS